MDSRSRGQDRESTAGRMDRNRVRSEPTQSRRCEKSEMMASWDLRVVLVTGALKEMGCDYPGVLVDKWIPGTV